MKAVKASILENPYCDEWMLSGRSLNIIPRPLRWGSAFVISSNLWMSLDLSIFSNASLLFSSIFLFFSCLASPERSSRVLFCLTANEVAPLILLRRAMLDGLLMVRVCSMVAMVVLMTSFALFLFPALSSWGSKW